MNHISSIIVKYKKKSYNLLQTLKISKSAGCVLHTTHTHIYSEITMIR